MVLLSLIIAQNFENFPQSLLARLELKERTCFVLKLGFTISSLNGS